MYTLEYILRRMDKEYQQTIEDDFYLDLAWGIANEENQ